MGKPMQNPGSSVREAYGLLLNAIVEDADYLGHQVARLVMSDEADQADACLQLIKDLRGFHNAAQLMDQCYVSWQQGQRQRIVPLLSPQLERLFGVSGEDFKNPEVVVEVPAVTNGYQPPEEPLAVGATLFEEVLPPSQEEEHADPLDRDRGAEPESSKVNIDDLFLHNWRGRSKPVLNLEKFMGPALELLRQHNHMSPSSLIRAMRLYYPTYADAINRTTNGMTSLGDKLRKRKYITGGAGVWYITSEGRLYLNNSRTEFVSLS